MSAGNLIDGRAIAEEIHKNTTQRVTTLKSRGVEPRLDFIRVGEDPASRDYVGRKEKSCARAGISSQTHVLSQTASEAALLDLILRLNADPKVHGILVQAPLPRHISETKVYSSVAPEKDVDGFHPLNV
ncbi:MAG TPA: tetrahydrofolate dehydrogenase/cyclohydrolase catalytic domain-containing protein, partial [Verrucomicrobiae bacterium]